jgi:hypothetical protein
MIIWLASYPRSGNTFFRILLNTAFNTKTYSIYDDPEDIGSDPKTSKLVGHKILPSTFNLSKARTDKKAYFIKTHELMNSDIKKTDKIVYLIRDGREATVSLINYHKKYFNEQKSILDGIYGNLYKGCWSSHVRSWDPLNNSNCLLIKFEDMVTNPDLIIDKVSLFLKVNPNNNSIPDFNELQKINPKFFHKGKISSWKSLFSKEEQILFWHINKKVMSEYGYENNQPQTLKSDKILTLISEYIQALIINYENEISHINSKCQEQTYKLKKINSPLIEEIKKLKDSLSQLKELLKQANLKKRVAQKELNQTNNRAYLQDKHFNKIKGAIRTLEKEVEGPIALYGAGKLLKDFMQCTIDIESEFYINYIIDDFSKGKVICGHKINALHELKEVKIKTVVITTIAQEEELRQNAISIFGQKTKIIKLSQLMN